MLLGPRRVSEPEMVHAGTPAPGPTGLETARQVQSRLLPQGAPCLRGLDCFGLCLPRHGVGGDFFAFPAARADRAVLALGDVAGRGIPAGLMMSTLKAYLESHYALKEADLLERLVWLNRFFLERTATHHFASLVVAEFEADSGRLLYANCGQVPPLVVRRNGEVVWLDPTATVLGLFENWTPSLSQTQLGPGDWLVLASDGVTEAWGGRGEEFGCGRLGAAVARRQSFTAEALVRSLVAEVRAWSGNAGLDDVTVVAAKVQPGPLT